ncbi:MAG: DUF2284 domain-containing protein [Elusimicrobia bacterium]|nr:DUF2284 domain-containing protein [Elusimicrobiota bacterium]
MNETTNQEKNIFEFNQYHPISDEKPNENFYEFIMNYSKDVKNPIIDLKNNSKNLKEYTMRIGFVFPLNVVIDEKIKDLCCLNYERYNGRIEPCDGITDKRKGCPPYSPKVDDTIKILKESTVFLILQFEKITDTIVQKYIHNLTVKIEKELTKKFNVLNTYCCGPCRVCAEGCTTDEECRFPNIRRFALESCGFWVNKICEKAADNTIYGDNNWKIEWVKNYGLPTQNPKEFKSVSGILLK